jgi:hypothetical protein
MSRICSNCTIFWRRRPVGDPFGGRWDALQHRGGANQVFGVIGGDRKDDTAAELSVSA